MCSSVLIGWKLTKGACILAGVPIAYKDEKPRLEHRPMAIKTKACSGIMFVTNAYPPRNLSSQCKTSKYNWV